jgi:hypothetical protein
MSARSSRAAAGAASLVALVSFALLLGIFVVQLWVHATRTSATFDEPVHVLAGYRYWECGDFTINPEHPPLLKLLAAAPLRWQRIVESAWPCGTRTASKVEVAYASARFVADNGMDRILIPARIAAASMSVLLAVLVFVLAWEMFDASAALLAVAILVFEPTVIAHGSLVTTDMALAATMLLAVYALYRYGQRPTVFRLLATGLAVGLMLAVKHSGILMLPILFLLMLVDCLLVRRQPPPHPLLGKEGECVQSSPPYEGGAGGGSTRWLRHRSSKTHHLVRGVLRIGLAFVVVLLVALGILWSSYGLRYYALPGAARETLSIPELLTSGGSDVRQSVPAQLIELVHRARIFPEAYSFGLADIVATNVRPTFLLGTVYPSGRWFYFPVAFAIKSSIALLILLPLSILTRELYRTHPRELRFLLLPSLAYFAISLTSSLNIGVRHLLPVYPFFSVVAAAGACRWSRRRRGWLYGLAALLVFHAGTALRTAPNDIAFANDLWGGTRNSYRLLNDSNTDWGQNLKLVAAYVETQGIHDCWFAAAGMADLVRPYNRCRALPAYNWMATERLVELVPPVIEGTVFISAWELPPWGGQEYASMAETPPIDVIGGSILVFRGRFEVPLAAALSYAGRSDQLLGWSRYAESLQDARQAVELGPNDPRTHWALAGACARNGLAGESRQEVEAAKRLAYAGPVYFASKVGGDRVEAGHRKDAGRRP